MGDLTQAAEEQAQNPLAMIRKGANLPTEEWNDARVAAVVKQFPDEFRRPENIIAFMERSVSSGLNPLKDELWAWEHRGELQFMVSRSGWIKIADRDPKVTGLEFGHVYDGDEFSFTESGGHIEVNHSGGMKKGNLIGAYCVVHHEEGDHIERRLMEDFGHLSSAAWRDSPDTMALTRVISTAVRMKCPEAAGMHSQAEFAASDGGRTQRAAASRKAEKATEDEANALAAELAEEAEEEMPSVSGDGDDGREIEVEATESEEGKASSDQEGSESSPSTETTSAASTDSAESSSEDTSSQDQAGSDEEDEPVDVEETKVCPICTDEVAKASYPGHMGGHSRAGYKLPDGVERVVQEGDLFSFVDEDGEIHEAQAHTWMDAVQAAQEWAEAPADTAESQPDAFDDDTGGFTSEGEEPEEGEETAESEPEPDEEPDWNEVYQDIMRLSREHPDGLGYVRSKATEVFEGRGVPTTDEGTVKTNELSALQLAELKAEMREELETATF